MTEEELFRLFILLRKPIPWDPVPPWVRLADDRLKKFNEIQTRYNTKLAQLETEKLRELTKIAVPEIAKAVGAK